MTKKASSPARPAYSLEQKLHAVRLVREQSLAITEVCKNLSISNSALKTGLSSTMPGYWAARCPIVRSRLSSSVFENWNVKTNR